MDLGSVLLGLAGIALGYRSLSAGVQRVGEGLRGGGPVPGGGPTGDGSRIPARVIPRAATKRMPPVAHAGAKTATKAGQMSVSLYEVRTLGDRLSVILDRAEQGRRDPRIIAWARKEVSRRKPGSAEWNGGQWQVAEKDDLAEAMAIFKGLRRDIRYTSDPSGLDTYAHPAKTLATGSGDCDEYTSTGLAALGAIGLPTRAEVIRTRDSSTPNHIFIQAGFPKSNPTRWVSLDASVAMPPGWRAPDSMIAERWIFETE